MTPCLSPLLALALASGLAAQDLHMAEAPSALEERLRTEPFQIVGMADNRFAGDRTQRVALRYRDGTTIGVKWARAAEGGWALNNQPRYELAAYELQKLFLDPEDYIVPPTALRVIPLHVYRQLDSTSVATFEGTGSVLVLLSYWLNNVTAHDSIWDPARFERDPDYAHHFANMDVLTYLIRHADANMGNVLISSVPESARVFAVDNGVAFHSPDSPRGTHWQELKVDRIPAGTARRLRALSREELVGALAVVAQLRVDEDGRLHHTDRTAKVTPRMGVEFTGDMVQMGLNDRELADVWTRLVRLKEMLVSGELGTF